jgi:hypothetical protein
MTLKEVYQANPNGFTLDLETGLMAKHESGYYVSLTNYCDAKPNFDAITKAYCLFSKVCGRKCYIGGWKDGENYYIDISIHIDCPSSKIVAFCIADQFNQKAIFDCKTKLSINVPV